MALVNAFMPVAEDATADLLLGKTVTAGGTAPVTPTNTANANDSTATPGAGHFSQTVSERVSFATFGGSFDYWWACDFGAAVTVERMRVWPGGPQWDSGYGWTNTVQWSDDGAAWTSAPFTLTVVTVPTGNTAPFQVDIAEHRYTLNTPAAHRYWRIRKSGTLGTGFYNGDGMSAWFVDGIAAVGEVAWETAPETIDGDDGTFHDADGLTVGVTTPAGAFWRGDVGATEDIGRLTAVLGLATAGDAVIEIQGGDADDWSDAATVVVIPFDATGSLTADELDITWDATAFRYWQLVLQTPDEVRVYEVSLAVGAVVIPTEPGRAILEIYVHDEDASRWGTATWATGAATGTEGIWSGAGWQDVTPQGVTAHIIWGSREPDKGILARQNAASWNVETYDPDRILDPGNADSPYYPQIVAGTPIRISHDTTIIRTGLIDRIGYKYKAPDYRGQLLCTDTISLLNQAKVPEDSILGDTLITRVQDAIEAAGVAVGGIPLPPSGAGFTYPAIAPLDTDNPRERSVWDHITAACEEVLFVPFIGNTAGLGLRNWGFPLDRGREITAANLEDLESVSHEDGLYSVVRVQGDDPLVAPIEREAAPLPRYGRRVYERTELTVDPEGFADAVLQERSWPGVRYSPGTIHCWTAEDVDYFGSLQIMERVTVTVPGAVSVEGRILGGELWVQHYRDNERGATWQFNFAVATEGSTAIGLTTLVSSQAGDTLLDSQTETDYLEAD